MLLHDGAGVWAGDNACRPLALQLLKSLCCGEERPEPPPLPPPNISRLEQDGSEDSDPLPASDEEEEPPLPRTRPERSEASSTEYLAVAAATGAA